VAIDCKKPTALIFIVLFFSITCFGQQSPQAKFDEANEALTAGNYREAITQYRNLENQNTLSGALFLNLGISYQRIDSLGKAKYYFLKAADFPETRKKAQEALRFVESQFSRQSAVLPKLPWDLATDWLQQHIGAKKILLFGVILLNIGVIIFVVHWFGSWNPGIIRLTGIALVILSILIISTGFYTNYIANRYDEAVMVSTKAPVLEKPQQEATLVSQAYEGYTFTVDRYQSQTQPGWSYVRMSNGLYGWIPSNEILIL